MNLTLTQVWGLLLILVLCPILGALPAIRWLTRAIAGKDLTKLGTGNPSVSAAFYHGGRPAGIAAILSEAGKGIAAVLLARQFFPAQSAWELLALIALVMGRYWSGGGAGTTNATWGAIAHDPITASINAFLSLIGFTLIRDRRQGRLLVLVLYPIIIALFDPQDTGRIGVAAALGAVLGWIYRKIPDDLDLPADAARTDSQAMFKFFRGDRAVQSLDDPLDPAKVGSKAATLARLRRAGYPVPMGWVLQPGDDPALLVNHLSGHDELTSELASGVYEPPLVVRSSAVGEDGEGASAAGQYETVADVRTPELAIAAIHRVFRSYDRPQAVQYRRDRGVPDASMAVLVQPQIRGVFSGVAFSRDPIARQGNDVLVEGLPGAADRVVSGRVTPESYRLEISEADLARWRADGGLQALAAGGMVAADRPHAGGHSGEPNPASPDRDPAGALAISDGESGDLPPWLVRQVALLARDLETRDRGVPQDVEWTYDGQKLWVLQSRPISSLQPIWTRKIAAEVIPGLIRPLTWSINRPLTCGVWGQIFTLVLGDRAADLDFEATADLHYGRAYFNATLLGEIFLRMGLPPDSLEFLTRGAKFSKPPLRSTLQNLPGLLRLVRREMQLVRDFRQDDRRYFAPGLAALARDPVLPGERPADIVGNPAPDPTAGELVARADRLLKLLEKATYYSILAPLSYAARRALFRVPDERLDAGNTPEVAAAQQLRTLAKRARQVLQPGDAMKIAREPDTLFEKLAALPDGREVLDRFGAFLDRFGYLSEVGTDIAVPTWKEDSAPLRQQLAALVADPDTDRARSDSGERSRQGGTVQQRLDLKGQVTEIYSKLLAELRWTFLALESRWLAAGWLAEPGDLFYLTFEEVRELAAIAETLDREAAAAKADPERLAALEAAGTAPPARAAELQRLARDRQQQLDAAGQTPAPYLAYGHEPPTLPSRPPEAAPLQSVFTGIGGSPGQVEGEVRVARSLAEAAETLRDLAGATGDRATIFVVPYTDSGWAPLLARARGLVCEVGGRLSHGAIVAREYGIPAVLDVPEATVRLRNGQRVRLDGERGTVEVLT